MSNWHEDYKEIFSSAVEKMRSNELPAMWEIKTYGCREPGRGQARRSVWEESLGVWRCHKQGKHCTVFAETESGREEPRACCPKADGEHGVQAPGSQGQAGRGESSWVSSAALDFSGLELSWCHDFICSSKHPHANWGQRLNRAWAWAQDRSKRLLAESRGGKQQRDKWTRITAKGIQEIGMDCGWRTGTGTILNI